MKLRILLDAELESAEAAAWYDDRQQGLGDDFLAKVTDAIHRIGEDPQSFARLESYAGSRDIRRCLLQRFPYIVLFECRAMETLIVAIAHSRRHPLYWLDRLS